MFVSQNNDIFGKCLHSFLCVCVCVCVWGGGPGFKLTTLHLPSKHLCLRAISPAPFTKLSLDHS